MKFIKHSLVVFAFFLIAPNLYGQVNYLNIGTEWYEEATYGATPGCLWTYKFQYTLVTDTNISGKTYFQLYYRRDEQNFFNNPSCGPTGLFTGYSYLLRQEGKKIIRRFNNTEEVLYDFDLEVGDTIQYKPFFADTVVAIDSVLVGSNWRKKFLLGNYNGHGVDYITEGIGHNLGLFYPDNPGPHISYHSSLHCFSQNGMTNPIEGGNCSFDLGISEEFSELKTYPNPATEFLNVSNPPSNIYQFTIFSLSGVLLKQGLLNDKVDISNLESGIYIIQIRNGMYLQRKRFVKL